MSLPAPDPSRVIRLSREPLAALSHQQAARRVRSGELERVRRGVVRRAPLPIELVDRFDRHAELRLRYLDRVLAVAETRRSEVVFAGRAALAIWDFAVVDPWPSDVELLDPPGSPRRSKRGVTVHRARFDDSDIVPWGDHFVTSPARTLADLARGGDFTGSIVALDHALSARATPAQSVTKDEVRSALERTGSARGLTRALAAVEFGDGRSGSGGESLSRVDIFRLGLELPELQVRHPHPDGFYDADFEWPAWRHRPATIGEFDGVMKYLKQELRGGADASEVVVAEKRREDFLRAQGRGFTRWGWREARQPIQLLGPQLMRAGIRVVRRPLIR
jgi:hypothetical protein